MRPGVAIKTSTPRSSFLFPARPKDPSARRSSNAIMRAVVLAVFDEILFDPLGCSDPLTCRLKNERRGGMLLPARGPFPAGPVISSWASIKRRPRCLPARRADAQHILAATHADRIRLNRGRVVLPASATAATTLRTGPDRQHVTARPSRGALRIFSSNEHVPDCA